VRYTIHRGQHEIGGMCIEVAADDGTRILLDLGMPLVAPGGGDFPRDTQQRPTGHMRPTGDKRGRSGLDEQARYWMSDRHGLIRRPRKRGARLPRGARDQQEEVGGVWQRRPPGGVGRRCCSFAPV